MSLDITLGAWIILSTQVVLFLTALVALFTAIKARNENRATHILFNSRMDEYMDLVKKAAHAEGVKEEKDNPS